jgi:hypothetical protein
MPHKKSRSPFRGADHRTIAAMRSLTRATSAWERALGTPDQYLEPRVDLWVYEVLRFSTIQRTRDRSLNRWRQMPHFEQSMAVYRDQHLKQYDRRAWENMKLRAEVERLRQMVEGPVAEKEMTSW